jgi:DNA-binding CsgD family transcriptional regulator
MPDWIAIRRPTVDNLFIKLLDRRGRIIWNQRGRDPANWKDAPLQEAGVAEHRQMIDENFYRCIVGGETVEFAAKWYCPSLKADVWLQTTFHPIDPKVGGGHIAALVVQSLLPENHEEFSETDREMLRLLADDHNIKDVAETVDRSESAIDTRIRNLKTKLGKHTLHGLIAGAIRGRLVHFEPPVGLEVPQVSQK